MSLIELVFDRASEKSLQYAKVLKDLYMHQEILLIEFNDQVRNEFVFTVLDQIIKLANLLY